MKEPGAITPLPCDMDAEKAILAAMLLVTEANYDIAETVRREWFYNPSHLICWDIIIDLTAKDVRPNLGAVTREIRSRKLEDQLPIANVAEIFTYPETSQNWRHYAKLLEAAAYRRAMRNASIRINEAAYDLSNDPAIALDAVTADLAELMSGGTEEACTPQELMAATLSLMEVNLTNPPGIKTGIESLDQKMRQWLPGCMHVVAARPGQGKTSFAARLLESWAIDQGIPSLFLSLEMTREQLGARLMSQIAGVPLSLVLGDIGRHPTTGELQAIHSAVERVEAGKFWIEDKATMTYRQAVATIRRHVRKNKVKVVFVDYLQRVHGLPRQDTVERISATSEALTEVAKQEGIVLIALAQFNREMSKRAGKITRPKLDDLKGSGQIEQDAATVVALHRPSSSQQWEDMKSDEQGQWNDEEHYRSYAEAVILKNRYGQVDTIAPLKWIGEQTRFESWYQ